MSKKVKFNSIDINVGFMHPKPAIKDLPEWYKDLPSVNNGQETVKKCMPFMDAMGTGYFLYLSADVYVDRNGFQQISDPEVVTTHNPNQIETFEVPAEYLGTPYKWMNFFTMKTPRGYSTLFTHPMNRIDLPFYSLSGVVETDKFELAVNFPFLLKKDFTGIINAGTPIIQALPFKRTDWESEVEDEEQIKLPTYRHTMHNPPFGFYKKHFWERKKYL